MPIDTIQEMKTTVDYLNEVIKKAGTVENDNQLALHIGITRQAIYQYRRGQNMSVEVAIRVAEKLGIDPLETVAATLHAQAKNAVEIAFWAELYQHLAQ